MFLTFCMHALCKYCLYSYACVLITMHAFQNRPPDYHRQSETHCYVLSFSSRCQLCVRAGGGGSVQPEMDHGASEEKAEHCHASRRWGNVNRVTVVLIIMAVCCRGSGGGILITKAVLSPVSCVAKNTEGEGEKSLALPKNKERCTCLEC